MMTPSAMVNINTKPRLVLGTWAKSKLTSTSLLLASTKISEYPKNIANKIINIKDIANLLLRLQ